MQLYCPVGTVELLLFLTLCAGELVRWVTVPLVFVRVEVCAFRDAIRSYFSSNSTGFMGTFFSRKIGLRTPNIPYFFKVMILIMSNNVYEHYFQMWEKTSVHLQRP